MREEKTEDRWEGRGGRAGMQANRPQSGWTTRQERKTQEEQVARETKAKGQMDRGKANKCMTSGQT